MAYKSPSTLADSRPKHMSSPISLHGIDISSLDARDVFGLTMGNDFSSHPSASPDLSRAREDVDRRSSRSTHSPSLSADRITDDGHISHFDPPPDSRSRSVSTWIYPSRQPTDSSPGLSIRAKDGDNPSSESKPRLLLRALTNHCSYQVLLYRSLLRWIKVSVRLPLLLHIPLQPSHPLRPPISTRTTQNLSPSKSACLFWEDQNHCVPKISSTP
jgi:hypothetical protein